jgi:hypothetical protein
LRGRFEQSDFTTKVQYRAGGRSFKVRRMRTKASGCRLHSENAGGINFRKVAEHHAVGMQRGTAPETERIFKLALNEAEALACESGVPELVLVSLAEEKVRAAREWFARQQAVKKRSPEWQIAA